MRDCRHSITLWYRESAAADVQRRPGRTAWSPRWRSYPELTPYGRLFKLTGYTLGERTLPFSGMAVVSDSKVSNTSKSDDPKADFQKNNSLIFATGSVFAAGKITDNIGAFLQVTYDNYASQSDDGKFHGHSGADNMDIRYADRSIDSSHDWIWGVSANNNPSISDVEHSAAWMQYVPVPSPTSSRFIDAYAVSGLAAGGNIAGINRLLLLEPDAVCRGGWLPHGEWSASFMSAGVAEGDKTKLQGTNPYWRATLTQVGHHNFMVGTDRYGCGRRSMIRSTRPDPNSVHHFRDIGVTRSTNIYLIRTRSPCSSAYMRDHHRVPGFSLISR